MLDEMPEIAVIRSGVGERLAAPWQYCTGDALSSDQLDSFSAPAISIISRGKRFRAIGAYIGWITAGGSVSPTIPDNLLDLGACLELFQASAIVHDDIIDDARYRRGLPSAHIAYTTSSPNSGPHFGRSAAILWGDLLYAAANSYFVHCANGIDHHSFCKVCDLFVGMQSEVAYGQYLDLSAETTEFSSAHPPLHSEAMEVIRHKTARYSVVIPMQLGAALAGASPELLAQIDGFAAPLGIAYQLRDDDLGIFGDQELTGKPTGDDIRSGKHTVQLALAWERTDDKGRDYLQRYWGAPDVTPPIIENIRNIITGSGARKAVSDLINQNLESSQQVLNSIECSPQVKHQLIEFGMSLVDRSS